MTPLEVLVVSPVALLPPYWGFTNRVHRLASGLAGMHRVTILAPPEPAPDESRGRRRGQLAAALTPTPYSVARACSPSLRRSFRAAVAERRWDAIVLESAQLAELGRGFGPARVLDEHNIEHELLERMARGERSALRRWYNRLEGVKLRRHERGAWPAFDGIAFTSAREVAVARPFCGDAALEVVPNGVDVEEFAPARGPVERDRLVFTGRMDYRPNVDAMIDFVTRTLPLVAASRPGVRLDIVGQAPPEAILRLAGPRVTVTGRVEDVRPYVARAAVVVVPLRFGAGTRLKILEALAMAKAVVSTPLGCEGLDVVDGREIAVRPAEPSAFARGVLELLADPETAMHLGAEGRERALREYAWPVAVERMSALLTAAVERRVRAATR